MQSQGRNVSTTYEGVAWFQWSPEPDRLQWFA